MLNINSFLYSLYNDVSASSISHAYRKKHGLTHDQTLVYGESHLPSLHEIFNEVKPKPGEVFYDFGSGGGRVVLLAALGFPFSKSVGVELLDDLVSLSQTKLELLKKEFPDLPCKVEFIQADFTTINTRDADIVYMASTCFGDKMMESLAMLLEEQLSSGARVITLTKNLPSKKFKITKKQVYPMEWGSATIFFHEKLL